MSTEALLHFITAALYVGLAVQTYSGMRLASSSGEAAPTSAKSGASLRAALMPLALLLHALSLYRGIFTPAGMNLGIGPAVSLIAWLSLLMYWLASFQLQVAALSNLLLPVAAIAVLLPLVLPRAHVLPYANMPSFRIHLLLSMLAYSLLTVAALHALLMAALDRSLHGGSTAPWVKQLPPLMPMETLLFRVLSLGFALLTLSLASGIIFSEAWSGHPFQLTHKVVFGMLSWLVFAALLVGRWRYGWRGRKAVRWTLTGFALLLLAYIGSKLVLEVVLRRG